jgi:hypothetical protein
VARWRWALALLGTAACEAVVGADFDAKQLAPPPGGSGGAPEGGHGGAGQGGEGGSLLENGSPCLDPAACASMQCVHGYCCDEACAGECQRCDVEGDEGRCTPLPVLSACPDTAGGVCDGSAFCATGTPRWSHVFGDGEDQTAEACAFDAEGAVWVGGTYHGDLDLGDAPLTTNVVGRRAFLARFDAAGALAFQTAIGDDNPSSTFFELHDLATGPDGSVAIVGRFDGVISYCNEQIASAADESAFVMKLTGDGDCAWIRRYEASELCGPHLATCPAPLRIAISSSGEVAVAGTFYDWVDYGDGATMANTIYEGMFVTRHAADGALVEGMVNGSSGGGGVLVGMGFSNGEIAVAGMFNSGTLSFGGDVIGAHGQLDVFAATVGRDGWGRSFGDMYNSYADSMVTDAAGNVILSSSFQSELNFGGGTITSNNPQPGIQLDLGLGKLRPDGSAAWPAVGFGPFSAPILEPIESRLGSDAAGNVVVAGRLRAEPVDFDGHTIPDEPESNFLVKLSSGADVLWAHAFGILDPPAAEAWPFRVRDVDGGPGGEVALCGFSANAVELGGDPLTPAGARDLVIAVFEP